MPRLTLIRCGSSNPQERARYIQIASTASASWIAWRDVEVYPAGG